MPRRKQGLGPPASRFSLAGQSVSHRAFLVFFLGSIVPLALLAFVAREYVLPRLQGAEGESSLASVSVAIVLVAFLSLLAYLVLRRAMQETVREIGGYNARLGILLETAEALDRTRFPDLLRRTGLAAAARLTGAESGFFFRSSTGPEAPGAAVQETWGDAAAGRLAAVGSSLAGAARETLSTGRAVVSAAEGSRPALLAVPVRAGDETFGSVVLAAAPDGAFESADVDSVMALAQQVSVALHNASLRDAQTNFFTHVTELLVSSLDLYVDSQVGHSKRVAYFCNLLGRAAELDEARLGRLYFAALLHDIGMLRLPRQSPAHVGGAEFREHPAHSGAMLEPITFWSDLVPFVRHHHERWDGRGYPDGLAAEAIPVEARIIGLTEAFDAMTHPHSYRPRRSTADALEEIERCAGSQFDPALAETFVSLVRRGEIQVE